MINLPEETKFTYTNEQGTYEAYKMGKLALRPLPPIDRMIFTHRGKQVLCDYGIVELVTGRYCFIPTPEELALFYLDELNSNFTFETEEELQAALDTSNDWAWQVLTTGEKVSYRQWLRDKEEQVGRAAE